MDSYHQNVQSRQRGGQQQGDHLYEDTSNQNFGGGYPPQQQMQPQQGYMQPSQLIPGALMNEPMANMALQYGSSIADQGKEVLQKNMEKYISTSTMKYYFAVDTKYVTKKIMLLLWPFSHQDWSTQYEQHQPVAPRFDINAADLYIPVMAFVTFILMNGLALGMNNSFTPEELGVRAYNMMFWFIIELIVTKLSLYLVSAKSDLTVFDHVSYAGYKYVGMNLVMAAGLFFNPTLYLITLVYTSLTVGYFLLKTLKLKIVQLSGSTGLYLIAAIAMSQSFFLFWLTKNAVSFFS